MNILFKEEPILETVRFSVQQDREVPIPGFFILSSMRNIRSIDELSEHELDEFIRILAKVRRGMKTVLHIHDVYFFQNEDTRHNFHFRMFPRYERMEQFGRKIESVRPIMQRAIAHMNDDETIKQVKDDVQKMRAFFEKL